jgi:predicted transcriptional regulator
MANNELIEKVKAQFPAPPIADVIKVLSAAYNADARIVTAWLAGYDFDAKLNSVIYEETVANEIR